MNIKVNDMLSLIVTYLNEVIATEFVMYTQNKDASNMVKLAGMLIDVRFQIDFTLMSSALEVQELYDKYRSRPVEESNIEIRTLMDISGYIHMMLQDEEEDATQPYDDFITRLARMVTLHSNVDLAITCQDESMTQTMQETAWISLLHANPWLVAMVCIRFIPSYYIVDMAITKLTDIPKVKDETRSPS